MAKVRGTNLTKEDFDKIKVLTSTELRAEMIADITGRSKSTVNRIKSVADYDAYIEQGKKYMAQSAKGKKAALRAIVAETVHVSDAKLEPPFGDGETKAEQSIPQDAPKLDRHLIALHRIGDQLERLADAWESPKKGLFR